MAEDFIGRGWRYPMGTDDTGGIALVQHRAISQHRHAQAFGIDQRRLPRLGEIAPGPDGLNALGAQQIKRVEQRLAPQSIA